MWVCCGVARCSTYSLSPNWLCCAGNIESCFLTMCPSRPSQQVTNSVRNSVTVEVWLVRFAQFFEPSLSKARMRELEAFERTSSNSPRLESEYPRMKVLHPPLALRFEVSEMHIRTSNHSNTHCGTIYNSIKWLVQQYNTSY